MPSILAPRERSIYLRHIAQSAALPRRNMLTSSAPMTLTSAPLILVVDDYQDGREMYAEYLAFRGFRVRMAESGEEAIRAVETEIPSLVLMDIGCGG